MVENKAPTHIAYALKRDGKRMSRWLEIGTARIDGPNKPAHITLDRTPIGGFNGYVYLSPVGVKPPLPESEPERPTGEEA
jgi:hypothetical protein